MKKRGNAPGPGRLALLFLAVAAVFAALFFGVEWIGRTFIVEKDPDDDTETREDWVPEQGIPGLAKNEYDRDAFAEEDGFIVYNGTEKASRGIDVSAHQRDIDWAAVAADGVEYAMLRVGYRGYTEGDTFLDEEFYDNVAGARENGIAVGVYFFSQAISAEEAKEEADIVLRAIEGLDITYPVVFDWEDIHQAEARTNQVDQQTLTDCAKAFCETVEAAGYTAGIYFNQIFGYQRFILPDLDQYVFWLAEYDSAPDFLYDFQMWQYTNEGTVNGIEGGVDLNLSFWHPEE